MQTKRIGLAIDSLAGGGAEKIVLTLAFELKKQGHEPHLLILRPNCDYAVPEHIPVHFCFEKGVRNIDRLWRLSQSVKQVRHWIDTIEAECGRFDLILSNLDKSNLLLTRAGVGPLYIVVHNAMEEELKRERKLGPLSYLRKLRAKKALNGQHLITVSKGIEQEIIERGRILPKSIQTIYNPFDFDGIRSRAQQVNPAIPQGDYLIHVGRVAKQKRHDILFKALLQMEHKLPLVLLCNNPKKAKKLARKYGVEDRIICPGFQENPFPWIKQAKLLVLSSDYEGLPTVLIESLICGTPVVSTLCPHGPSEILTEELIDYLVPRRDVIALAAKLDEALEHYPQVGHCEIFDHIAVDKTVRNYLALCDETQA
ncbi:glycosyltransferase [Shewanella sp. AS1]|uniref:glycosyltransferase n=1 Tax=Shewanella sp. AS1 TaxID=2907626 RepID=UPI001F1656D5|nr:glycosyltransferase [Shewanella sp. AS1]MCE9680430.1 glycosyltransferase [Shewanella sp. AS1]